MPNELIPYDRSTEFELNPEPRFPCAIVIDTSSSTEGEAIAQIGSGLEDLAAEVRDDDLTALRAEIAVVTFGGHVRVVRDFTPAQHFRPPPLTAGGGTPLAEAVLLVLDVVEARLRVIEAADVDAYPPWVYLLTDGQPTSPKGLLDQARQRIRQVEDEGRIGVFAVGTNDADMEFLRWLTVRTPCRIPEVDHQGMFRWVAKSIHMVSESIVGQRIEPPDPERFGLCKE